MRWALRLLAPILLIGLCFWVLGTAEIGARLVAAKPIWIGASVAALFLQTILMALRWRLVACCLGAEMSFGWALREYLAGQLLNATLPGGVIGDAARAVRARIGRSGLRRATQAVVIERMAGQVGLALVAGVGLAATLAIPGGFVPPPFLTLIMVIILAMLTGSLLAATQLERSAALIRRCLPTLRVTAIQTTISVAAALLNVAAFAACARATGTVLGIGAALVLIPVILTAMLIPLSVGGWGWREGAAAALFPIGGADPAAGVAAGIAFGTAILLSTLPAGAFALSGRPKQGVRPIEGDAAPKGTG